MTCKGCNFDVKKRSKNSMVISPESNLTSRLVEGDTVELKVVYYQNRWHLVAYYNGDKEDKEVLGELS